MLALRTLAVGLGLSALLLSAPATRLLSQAVQLDGLGVAKPIADALAAASALGAPAYMAFMPLLASLAAGLFTATLVWPLIERLALSVVDAPAVAVDMGSELLRKRRKALAGARLTT